MVRQRLGPERIDFEPRRLNRPAPLRRGASAAKANPQSACHEQGDETSSNDVMPTDE